MTSTFLWQGYWLDVEYVGGASYLGPNGSLTEMIYGGYADRHTGFSYSPETLQMTSMHTNGLSLSYKYRVPDSVSEKRTGHIYDITDNYDNDASHHYEYDSLYRLSAFWVSNERTDPFSEKLAWTYDAYSNIATMSWNYDPDPSVATYTVDASTNRLQSTRPAAGWPLVTYSYDAAGNMTSKGTFDAENRLLSSGSVSYLYDAHSRRLRTLEGGTKIYFIYSLSGRLLVEDNWTAGTTKNQIYFNGQLIATHDQANYVCLFFRDHLGSIRSVIGVEPSRYWGQEWETIAVFAYKPYGEIASSWILTDPGNRRFGGKERDSNGLGYFGARYYWSGASPPYGWPDRWISPDPVMAIIYDPPSLNRYTYVRGDPINFGDADGRNLRVIGSCSGGFAIISWIEGSEGGYGGLVGYGMCASSGSNDEYELPIYGPSYQGPPRIDPRVGDAKSVRKDLSRALNRADCLTFLNNVISQLQTAGSLSTSFTTSTLVSNIADVARITVDLVGRGRYGHVVPGTDHIQLSEAGLQEQSLTRGRPEHTQDLWARLLHEGFHLKSTHKPDPKNPSAFINDGELADALEQTRYLIGARSIAGDSPGIARTFAAHCGPKARVSD